MVKDMSMYMYERHSQCGPFKKWSMVGNSASNLKTALLVDAGSHTHICFLSKNVFIIIVQVRGLDAGGILFQ